MSYPLMIDESRPAYGFDFVREKRIKSDKAVIIDKPPTVSISAKVLFKRYVEKWKRETAHQSFISRRLQHPAYRHILNMGQIAIPFILEEMKQEPDHWFYALVSLTGENPVPANFTGTVSDAAELWIRWGQSKYAA